MGGGAAPVRLRAASKAATRALSSSFSSRARRAISLTASNSSRVTTSSSRIRRSAWARNRVSTSRRIPCAAPAASFINRAISSKKRLWSEPSACLRECGSRMQTMQNGASPRAAARCHAVPASCHSPLFSPVLISFGPFAIRWYALAYIFGILFGWLYARALIRREPLWGGKPPLTVERLRRLHRLGDARHRAWRPHRLCPVLQPAHFAAHPIEILEVWKGGMSFHGGFLGCVLAVRPVCAAAAASRSCRSAT